MVGFSGIKNAKGVTYNEKTGKFDSGAIRQKFDYNGDVYSFEPGEIKILPDSVVSHFSERNLIVTDPKTKELVGQYQPFERVELQTAIKAGAKLPEHPAQEQAREIRERREAEKRAIEAELRAEIMAELKAKAKG